MLCAGRSVDCDGFLLLAAKGAVESLRFSKIKKAVSRKAKRRNFRMPLMEQPSSQGDEVICCKVAIFSIVPRDGTRTFAPSDEPIGFDPFWKQKQ